MISTCGDDPTGVKDCFEPIAVFICFTSYEGVEYAACLCHRHAAGLRSGEDIWDCAFLGYPYDDRPYKVTRWESIE